MSTREQWLDIEMVISLAFYMFEEHVDDKRKLDLLAFRLNKITGKNRTGATFGFRMANYKSVDPNYKKVGFHNGGVHVQKYWDKYVTNEPSLETLANIYANFLNGFSIKEIYKKQPVSVTNNNLKAKTITTVVYSRSETVKNNTLNRAAGKCEFCGSEAPFLTDEGKPYLEVHHFIPLSEGGQDSTSNTLALCPNCHRKLHYGPKLKKEEKTFLLSKMK